jgi:signal transduction histidine kinase
MQLRAGHGDDGSLAHLQDDVRGVLAELRDLATELRPSSLGQLGLVPALEAIDSVTVQADDIHAPVPEPLRTGVFRLVEHVVAGATTGATVQVQVHDDELSVTIDAELADAELVAAAEPAGRFWVGI